MTLELPLWVEILSPQKATDIRFSLLKPWLQAAAPQYLNPTSGSLYPEPKTLVLSLLARDAL